MRPSITLSLLTLLFATCVSAAEPTATRETRVDGIIPISVGATDTASFDTRREDSHLPTIYIPYVPGQQIPYGWKLVTVRYPVKEVRTRTVCEEQIVQVPRKVPCLESKTIRFPTEIYKTYVKFKEIKVEDGTLRRHEHAPEAELDDLDLGETEDDTVPVSVTSAGMRNAAAGGPPRDSDDSKPHSQKSRPARPGYEWVPVTKVRKKQVVVQVPVTRIVEVDEGCWKEIVVHVPAPCRGKPCPPGGQPATPLGEGGTPPATLPVIRRVWQPRIVQREVTVTESREITVDETYTDYVEQPATAPDIAPDTGPETAPDTAPDIAPDVMVTTDRIVRIPQYVTKAERHYLTKTIQVPGFKTVYDSVKKTVRQEVPYEVVRTCEKLVLVPCDSSVIPPSLLAEPPRQPEAVEPDELLPPSVPGAADTPPRPTT